MGVDTLRKCLFAVAIYLACLAAGVALASLTGRTSDMAARLSAQIG